MSGYGTTLYSRKIVDAMYKIMSFRVSSFMFEFGLWWKVVSETVINGVNDNFPQYSANIRYFKCIENRPSKNEMTPIPASMTMYVNLTNCCFYAIGFCCVLLVCELLVGKSLKYRRTQQVNQFMRRQPKIQFFTNHIPNNHRITPKITVIVTNWQRIAQNTKIDQNRN